MNHFNLHKQYLNCKILESKHTINYLQALEKVHKTPCLRKSNYILKFPYGAISIIVPIMDYALAKLPFLIALMEYAFAKLPF